MKRKLKVAVLVSLDTRYKYDNIRGIIQFAKRHDEWSLYGHNQMFRTIDDLKHWRGDGIIADINSRKEAERLASIGLPIVDLCGSVTANYDYIAQITNDDFQTGHSVAEHFLRRNFTEFAFVGMKQYRWSIERRVGFCEEINARGLTPDLFMRSRSYWQKNSPQKDLREWLERRPLAPLAIMAADDQIGVQVIEACLVAKIQVPNEVAIVGVNNDVVICEFCNPTLSSVALDDLQVGQQAAATLHEMMTNPAASLAPEPKRIAPLAIKLRDSSSYETQSSQAVRAAINFIRDHNDTALSVNDVVTHCRVGRRTLEVTFKKICGHSIYDEICRQRIQRACILLQRSNETINEIAYLSGFNSYQRFHSIFRKYMKVTPKAYRGKYIPR